MFLKTSVILDVCGWVGVSGNWVSLPSTRGPGVPRGRGVLACPQYGVVERVVLGAREQQQQCPGRAMKQKADAA